MAESKDLKTKELKKKDERKTSVLKARLIEVSDLIERGEVDIDDLENLIKETNEISLIIRDRLEATKKMLEQ